MKSSCLLATDLQFVRMKRSLDEWGRTMPMLLVPLNYTLKTVSYMVCILYYNEKLPLASSHTPQKKKNVFYLCIHR